MENRCATLLSVWGGAHTVLKILSIYTFSFIYIHVYTNQCFRESLRVLDLNQWSNPYIVYMTSEE